MHKLSKISKLFALFSLFFTYLSFLQASDNEKTVPILCYHRFSEKPKVFTEIKTKSFERQLKWLDENGYKVIPLEDAVDYISGNTEDIPEKAVVLTVDDGHRSVYFAMADLVKKYKVPVTLFIYPSAISNAKYAMTWKQLVELEDTGLFRVQSHSYWHPNFNKEKKRLSPEKYRKFVDFQLAGSKKKLEKEIGHSVKFLAWPYGIYDSLLEDYAVKAGYLGAFTIKGKVASRDDNVLEIPRIMIVNSYGIKTFADIIRKKNKDKN